MQGVFDAGLLLFHFHFGGGTNVDLGHTAGQLGQALLELLAVVVAAEVVLDLGLDLLDADLDVGGLAATFDDGGGVLGDGDLLGPPESLTSSFSRSMPSSSMIGRATGEDRDVLEHGLATITEAGALTAATFRTPRSLLTTSGEGFAVDVFGDDEQALAALGDLAEDRKDVLCGGDLLLVDQDVAVLEIRVSISVDR